MFYKLERSVLRRVPEASPVRSRPIINMGTLVAIAIKIHPSTPGMAANLTVLSLPMESMMKPPDMAPIGTTRTITLAEKRVSTLDSRSVLTHRSMAFDMDLSENSRLPIAATKSPKTPTQCPPRCETTPLVPSLSTAKNSQI